MLDFDTTAPGVRNAIGLGAALGLFLMAGVQGAAAQDVRTLPFEGCWSPAGGSGPDLCIERSADGLELLRVSEAGETGREIVALGAARDLEREGCTGTEWARFSNDGQRILVRSEYACEGGVERVESGILSLPARSGRIGGAGFEQLLDVRSVTMGDESVAWVQRYRLKGARSGVDVNDMRLEVARRAAASEIGVDDVVDAADFVHPEAVQAWIAESGTGFDLDGETLVALADEGVAPEVLDVMIAVSHPEYFALAVDGGVAEAERVQQQGGVARGPLGGGAWGFSPWGWGGAGAFGWGPAFGWDPYFGGFGFNRFGWASRWGAFGRAGWGWGGGAWGGGVVVVPGGGSGGSAATGGRVVNGRGYSRGRGGTSTGRSAPARGSRPVAAPSRGPRSSGAATRGGRSTGRTAKPRRGGGGGGDLF